MKGKRLFIGLSVFLAALIIGGLVLAQSPTDLRQTVRTIFNMALTPQQIKVLAAFEKDHWADQQAGLQKQLDGMEKQKAVSEQLGISLAQEDAFIGLAVSKIDTILPLANPVFQDAVALRAAVTADNPDEAQIRAAAAKLGQTMGDVAVVATGNVGEAKAILSADQIALIGQAMKDGEAEAQAMRAKAPEMIDTGLKLYYDLGITPQQIDALIQLSQPYMKIFHEQLKLRGELVWLKLQLILKPGQFKMLKAFADEHAAEGEAQQKAQMDKALGVWYSLDLTKAQMDQLVAIGASHKDQLLAMADTGQQLGKALTDAMLADSPDEAAIRGAAANIGAFIGDAAVLASQMIQEGKAVLTPDQYALLLNTELQGEQEGYDALQKAPAQLQEVAALWYDLNLTADQRAKLKALGDEETARHERIIKMMIAFPEPIF